MNSPTDVLTIDRLTHRYGDRTAVNALTLSVQTGALFGLLGPNGSGKTTLFRILTTILPLQEGTVTLAGADLKSDPEAVRHALGVTFQSASLDDRLTIAENMIAQGQLYGMRGRDLRSRVDSILNRFNLSDRSKDKVESLSGGLKRRVEIAKGLLHRPRLLLLDEPTTGLDPTARRDVWTLLKELRDEFGITILATTHIMEEAELCDQLAILDRGNLVAEGTPAELRNSIGGDTVSITSPQPESLQRDLQQRFDCGPQLVGNTLRIEHRAGHQLLSELMTEFGERIESVTLGKPTLEDVFIARTGRVFAEMSDDTDPDC